MPFATPEKRRDYLRTSPKVKAGRARNYAKHAKERREYHREKRKDRRAALMADPVALADYRAKKAAYQRRYREANLEIVREHNRASYRARFATPEGHVESLLMAARSRAKRDGREFAITLADVLPLPEVCPVLGVRLAYGFKGTRRAEPASPSIDRIDNRRGYVPGNVRIISQRANELRRDASAAELALVAADAQRIALTISGRVG